MDWPVGATPGSRLGISANAGRFVGTDPAIQWQIAEKAGHSTMQRHQNTAYGDLRASISFACWASTI